MSQTKQKNIGRFNDTYRFFNFLSVDKSVGKLVGKSAYNIKFAGKFIDS